MMDANLCVSGASWLLGELVRAFHSLSTQEAQHVVNAIVEIKTPVVWDGGDIRRLATNEPGRSDEVLILVASDHGPVSEDDLQKWMGISQRSNLRRLLDKMHDSKLIEAKSDRKNVRVMPLGASRVRKFLSPD